MARQKIIAGNWKMNGNLKETESLLKGIINGYKSKDSLTAVVCPPFTSLTLAAWVLEDSGISLGAQDISENNNGAYTGDISAEMLKEIGVKFVIIGHSERRQYHHESDKRINIKIRRALDANLTPIVCIGENLEQRENGETDEIVSGQFEKALAGFSGAELKKLVIAYEPVWAIGTGKTASPEMAQEVHKLIREKLRQRDAATAEIVPIIYGGSVKPDNAAGLMAQPDIDGALVGGASLEADSFLLILAAA